MTEMAAFINPGSLPSATKGIFTYQTVIGVLVLGNACMYFDYSLQLQAVASSHYCRAFVDSVAHGFVGALSWAIVIEAVLPKSWQHVREILICWLLSSAIDVDHFVAAKSIYLQDALVIPNRPALHSTSLILLIAFLLFLTLRVITRFTASNKLQPLPYMFLTAALSHHIRDAARRGLWFWPLGTTPPLPYWAYIGHIAILPVVMKLFYDRTLSSTLPLKASNDAVSAESPV